MQTITKTTPSWSFYFSISV